MDFDVKTWTDLDGKLEALRDFRWLGPDDDEE
jgi:hypothetical protein